MTCDPIPLWVSYSFVSSIGNCLQIPDICRVRSVWFDSCFLLHSSKQGFGGFFSPTNFVVVIESFYVHICGELWVFMNCVGSILSLSHIVFSPLLSYILLFLLKKKYSCYFYVLHLWILAINKKWKWMFFCVLSTNKSPTHILPLVHVSFILYCSFAFCGQLHFQNGHLLLPFWKALFLFSYFYLFICIFTQ